METLKVEIQNEEEKKVLLAFLDSLNYRYSTRKGKTIANEQEEIEFKKRKRALFEGRTTSLPWNETQMDDENDRA